MAEHPSEVRGSQVRQGNRGEGVRQGYTSSGRSFRMAPEHYNAYFGHEHPFRPWHVHPYLGYGGWGWGGRPVFWYGGFYWGFSIWPYEVGPYWWGYDDPIYIVIENDTYYAKDDQHPDQEIPLTPAVKQEEGTVRVTGGTPGDQVLIDKALVGYIGSLKDFKLPVGEHSIEVKGKGPYFGEDIMVLADQELTVDVGQ